MRASDNTNGPVRQEASTLLRLAGPIVVAQVAMMGLGITDAIVAGHASAVDLAGVTIGGSLFWPVFLFFQSTLMAVTPIVSQLDGARRSGEAGETVRQAAWLIVPALGLALLLGWQAPMLSALIGIDREILPVAIPYLRVMIVALPALLTYSLLRNYCEGLSVTRPAMLIGLGALPLNAMLDLAFVHGWFGLPRLGGVGCGWATVVIVCCEVAAMLWFASRPALARGRLFEAPRWPSPSRLREILRIGLPIGTTTFLEMMIFTLVTLLVGQFGALAVASHQIAFQVNGLTFMFPLALGMAASIRVGYNIGAGDLQRAAIAARLALALSVGCGLIGVVVLVLLRDWIPLAFTDDPQVLPIASTLILFVAGYQVVDNAQATTIGALRGYKDTGVPMAVALTGYWLVALPLAIWLGYHGWAGAFAPLGVYGFWIGLTLGLCFVAVLVFARLIWLTSPARFDRVRQLSGLATAAGDAAL